MKTLICQAGGIRLDRFILQNETSLHQGILRRYHRENRIKVNHKKQPLGQVLQAGDEVQLYMPAGKHSCLALVYEDENLLVADKPAGLVCQNRENPQADSLEARAAAYLQGGELYLCHRLDTGTSGLVLMAKNPAALAFVEKLLAERSLGKTYLAVCLGRPCPAAARLSGWLVKHPAQGRVKISPQPLPGAKPVETAYRTLAGSGALCLLELNLLTGRTHQIRAHMASIGHPLLGDSRYGNARLNRQLKCRYQCLCAYRIAFPAISGGDFARYSGFTLEAKPPWFYQKLLNGELG